LTLEELLRRPRVPYSLIEGLAPAYDDEHSEPFPFSLEIETDIKYAGYIERQKAQIEAAEKYDQVRLPDDVDYQSIEHLSKETREKLNRIRPANLGQASRIGGVRPADISVLMIWLETRRKKSSKVAFVEA
ncbi:MAG TPA: tRNA uridine-5-carboxymethylaminomethyl(34) synthesis enzyme MnmG, partial [Candidatus Melainabacteria bacterium]|nr:tRNA uridine-5-carboxymethylaminomethyl(34) synthesis enzyme MnmG [Candidatus Melainabacteria bacterium]